MRKYTKNQKEIVNSINTIMEYVYNTDDWLNIAYVCATSEIEDVGAKLEKVLEVALKENQKLYDYADDLLCKLDKLL